MFLFKRFLQNKNNNNYMSIKLNTIDKYKSSIPWVEKYRPNNFESIILDNNNKLIFENILNTGIFPNLLFYGPPGTGKTTTIINLINKYQNIYNDNKNNTNKSLILHLNASDDRGIEIIRNNICNFVVTENLFCKGLKFIILDEVDYMTKTAQLALKILLQNYYTNIRFCLICNYISKIESSLQNEFVKIRFNSIPDKDLYNFINKIVESEKINISSKKIISISKFFNNDIRSMINYFQINYNNKILMIKDDIYLKLYNINLTDEINKFINKVLRIEKTYDISVKNILKEYLIYIINNEYIDYKRENIHNIELFFHENESSKKNIISYVYYLLR